MAYRKINENVDQILLQHLRELADEEGYVTFSARAFALDRGISYSTIQKHIGSLQRKGKLEYTNMGKKGTLVHLLKKEQPSLRKCPKCGELAHDDKAMFCHRCGASLLTEKEQLKIGADRILPMIYREINDPRLCNELSYLMGKLINIVFEED